MGIHEIQESLPLLSLNHVSFVCKSVIDSVKFYQEVLGFVLVKRPSSFDFEGACSDSAAPRTPSVINPKDDHISFQSQDNKANLKDGQVFPRWKKHEEEKYNINKGRDKPDDIGRTAIDIPIKANAAVPPARPSRPSVKLTPLPIATKQNADIKR
ncbi:hypothetical protein QJS10_CPB12g00526 [Acorus calamus]|uniref:Glyoxalase/fosfomycin resistance/dioxygenase domain-containing protein n=1 Tax=Acorus calamus TaxID=4465 RepID=A0AAV9DPK7_ACOCL|nr:hypothetical protein QJS10_CPB12g00526 [Acorus calamus]